MHLLELELLVPVEQTQALLVQLTAVLTGHSHLSLVVFKVGLVVPLWCIGNSAWREAVVHTI